MARTNRAGQDDIWLNEKKIEVILKVTGEAAGFFRRRKLVPQQEIVKELQEDGGLLVSTHVAHETQILSVVREWIPHIRIVSPEGLQAEMETGLRSYLQGN
jgi:predicted DNA-binding transcriptional regulator YafY